MACEQARVGGIGYVLLQEAVCAQAFEFMRLAQSKRILKLAHLLQLGTTQRSIQAALVPLERVDTRSKVTDAEIMGIRDTDTATEPTDRVAMAVVADNIRSTFNTGGIFRSSRLLPEIAASIRSIINRNGKDKNHIPFAKRRR